MKNTVISFTKGICRAGKTSLLYQDIGRKTSLLFESGNFAGAGDLIQVLLANETLTTKCLSKK